MYRKLSWTQYMLDIATNQFKLTNNINDVCHYKNDFRT